MNEVLWRGGVEEHQMISRLLMVPNMDGPQEVTVLGSREKLKIIIFQLFVISFNYLTKYVCKTKLTLLG